MRFQWILDLCTRPLSLWSANYKHAQRKQHCQAVSLTCSTAHIQWWKVDGHSTRNAVSDAECSHQLFPTCCMCTIKVWLDTGFISKAMQYENYKDGTLSFCFLKKIHPSIFHTQFFVHSGSRGSAGAQPSRLGTKAGCSVHLSLTKDNIFVICLCGVDAAFCGFPGSRPPHTQLGPVPAL